MAGWWRQAAQELGIAGSGSWKRRIAEALQAVEGDGPWTKHIAEKGIQTVPPDGAVVTDSQSIALKGPDQSSSFGTVSAKVASGAINAVTLPTGSAVITNQAASVPVQDADGTQVGCTATIQPQTGFLSYIAIPGTAALVADGIDIRMSSAGGVGNFPGKVKITGGFINWAELKNATDAIVTNGFTVNLAAPGVSASGSDYASVNVAAGAITGVTPNLIPTKAVVSDQQALTVPVTGTYTTTAKLTVAGGVVTGIVLS